MAGKKDKTRARKAKSERLNDKNWAEGVREDVLTPYLEEYSIALGRNWAAERACLAKVQNHYHAVIPWRLSHKEEPLLPLPAYNPLSPPVVEDLTPEDTKLRATRYKKENTVSTYSFLSFHLSIA